MFKKLKQIEELCFEMNIHHASKLWSMEAHYQLTSYYTNFYDNLGDCVDDMYDQLSYIFENASK